jgi:hypothetical protein
MTLVKSYKTVIITANVCKWMADFGSSDTVNISSMEVYRVLNTVEQILWSVKALWSVNIEDYV